jgi:hypothetical protein
MADLERLGDSFYAMAAPLAETSENKRQSKENLREM